MFSPQANSWSGAVGGAQHPSRRPRKSNLLSRDNKTLLVFFALQSLSFVVKFSTRHTWYWNTSNTEPGKRMLIILLPARSQASPWQNEAGGAGWGWVKTTGEASTPGSSKEPLFHLWPAFLPPAVSWQAEPETCCSLGAGSRLPPNPYGEHSLWFLSGYVTCGGLASLWQATHQQRGSASIPLCLDLPKRLSSYLAKQKVHPVSKADPAQYEPPLLSKALPTTLTSCIYASNGAFFSLYNLFIILSWNLIKLSYPFLYLPLHLA